MFHGQRVVLSRGISLDVDTFIYHRKKKNALRIREIYCTRELAGIERKRDGGGMRQIWETMTSKASLSLSGVCAFPTIKCVLDGFSDNPSPDLTQFTRMAATHQEISCQKSSAL